MKYVEGILFLVAAVSAVCEYCGRLFSTVDVDQADLPFPEHVTCSDVCSVIMFCRKPVPA